MNLNPMGFAGMAIVMCAIPAVAHHSFAMFDAEKQMTIEGSVKEFQWTNPHSWIHVMVPDESGKQVQWSVELGSPAGLVRQGWIPKTLTPGMKVQLIIHPLRDDSNGGHLLTARLPDDTQMDGGRDRPGLLVQELRKHVAAAEAAVAEFVKKQCGR